jgi:hypothetical protein
MVGFQFVGIVVLNVTLKSQVGRGLAEYVVEGAIRLVRLAFIFPVLAEVKTLDEFHS